VTNLTQVTTLVRDPHIQITPQLARAFGSIVDLVSVPEEYSAGVGIWTKRTCRIWSTIMPYSKLSTSSAYLDLMFVFGEAIGNAVLSSDPCNLVGGTVPKSTAEIA